MTCKAFIDKDKSKKTLKRLGSVKGVKIEGKAQMDSFSGELTVMANTIIEGENKKKVKDEPNGCSNISIRFN